MRGPALRWASVSGGAGAALALLAGALLETPFRPGDGDAREAGAAARGGAVGEAADTGWREVAGWVFLREAWRAGSGPVRLPRGPDPGSAAVPTPPDSVADEAPERGPEPRELRVWIGPPDPPDGSFDIALLAAEVLDAAGTVHRPAPDGTGRIVLRGLPEGRVQVAVRGPGLFGAECGAQGEGIETVHVSLCRTEAVEGRVVAEPGSLPMEGAEVAVVCRDLGWGDTAVVGPRGRMGLLCDSARTGADGRFRLEGCPKSGGRFLAAWASGFAPLYESLHDMAPGALTLRLAACGILAGTVRDSAGRPVPGARVRGTIAPDGQSLALRSPRMRFGEAALIAEATADARGQYRLEGLASGAALSLVAEAGEGLRSGPVEDAWVPGAGETVVRDLVLLRPGRLTVRVEGPDGRPDGSGAANVVAYLLGDRGDPVRLHEDGEEPGAFLLDPAPAGTWAVRVGGPRDLLGRAETEVEVEVAEGEAAECALLLPASAMIRGVVLGAPGAAPEQARVRPDAGGNSAEVGEDGTFSLHGPDPGGLGLHVEIHDMSFPVAGPAPGSSEVLEVRLPAFGCVRFRLPGESDPEEVTVCHSAHPGPDGEVETLEGTPRRDEDGSFLAGPVLAGANRLWIRAAGSPGLEVPVEVPPGGVADLGTVPLGEGVEVRGLVVDPEGRPVPGATVGLWYGPRGVDDMDGWETDAEGRFSPGRFLPGPHAAEVTADGFPRLLTVADVDETGEVIVVFPRGGLVRGRVRAPDGRPLRRGVFFHPPDHVGWDDFVDGSWSDERGEYGCRLPAGSYVIEGYAGSRPGAGRSVEVGRVEVGEGAVVDLDLVMVE